MVATSLDPQRNIVVMYTQDAQSQSYRLRSATSLGNLTDSALPTLFGSCVPAWLLSITRKQALISIFSRLKFNTPQWRRLNLQICRKNSFVNFATEKISSLPTKSIQLLRWFSNVLHVKINKTFTTLWQKILFKFTTIFIGFCFKLKK